MTLRIGLLTTANINRNVLATRSADASYRFVAVGSRNLGRAEAYAREWGIERAHGSYDHLLADDAVDAVYIALPNALHHEWTMRTLAAGKHVLCEKPYTRHPEQAEEAWSEAERRGLVLMEAFMWRHHPQTALVREALPRIGDLRSIHATFCFPLVSEVNVRLERQLGGGSLLDVGCYCVSGARLLAGREPDRAYGESVVGRGGVDEEFAGTLRFGDVVATFQCGFRSTQRSLVAVGAEGTVSVHDPWLATDGRVVVNGKEHKTARVSAYRLELENLAAAIRGEAKPHVSRADSLGQARTLDALLRSAETHAPVALAGDQAAVRSSSPD